MKKNKRAYGIECPWCHDIPIDGFPVKKRVNLHGKIERWHDCGNCGKDFISIQQSVKEPYRKKNQETVYA